MPFDWYGINEPGYFLRPTLEGDKQPSGRGEDASVQASAVRSEHMAVLHTLKARIQQWIQRQKHG